MLKRMKNRVVLKCFESLVWNNNTNKRKEELKQIQQREERLQELHQQIVNNTPTTPTKTDLQSPDAQIIIVPDPELLKQIQELTNKARKLSKSKQLKGKC